MAPIQLIIFTDMDGSLLDHQTYSHMEANDLLAWLRNKQIPVIPCTSKTQAEMEILRQHLHNDHPFIVENGAAVYMPKKYFSASADLSDEDDLGDAGDFYVKRFTQTRAHWQAILAQVPMHLNDAFITFEQAGVEGIMQMTGLAFEEARLASQREYGEPLKWLGNDQQFNQFEEYIHSRQGKLLKGGRFVHLSGECNKGNALVWLLQKYRQKNHNQQIVCIALGDSQNDVAMLSIADYAVVIRSPAHEFPVIESKDGQQIYYTNNEGPKGWKEGVCHVLAELGINK